MDDDDDDDDDEGWIAVRAEDADDAARWFVAELMVGRGASTMSERRARDVSRRGETTRDEDAREKDRETRARGAGGRGRGRARGGETLVGAAGGAGGDVEGVRVGAVGRVTTSATRRIETSARSRARLDSSRAMAERMDASSRRDVRIN